MSTTHVMCRASLVPIVCPASSHMRKGMACVSRHHILSRGDDLLKLWLDITSGVSNRTNRFRPRSQPRGVRAKNLSCGRSRVSPQTPQHHEPASSPSAGIHNHTFSGGARSRRVRSRESTRDPCSKQSSDVAGVPRPACRPGFFLDASSMTRGVCPPFRRWMDLSDQQSTCAKVSIESSPWTLVWCTAADGHRTYSAVRPMLSSEVVVVSFLVQRSF